MSDPFELTPGLRRELEGKHLGIGDPEAWPPGRIDREVEFTLSEMGRLRREDREIAFALEIVRLRSIIERKRAMLVRVGPAMDGDEEKEALFVNPDHVAAIYPSRCEGETMIKLSCGEEVYVDDITPTELAQQLNSAITASSR